MRPKRFETPAHSMKFAGLLALAVFALVAWAPPARACSCSRPSLRTALEGADFVADVRVLEVRALGDGMMSGQALLYRVERIYKAPATIAEGDEIWVYHQTCNSSGYTAREVGGRRIWFMNTRRGVLGHHFCSTSLDSYAAVPHVLLESRAHWLESRP